MLQTLKYLPDFATLRAFKLCIKNLQLRKVFFYISTKIIPKLYREKLLQYDTVLQISTLKCLNPGLKFCTSKDLLLRSHNFVCLS